MRVSPGTICYAAHVTRVLKVHVDWAVQNQRGIVTHWQCSELPDSGIAIADYHYSSVSIRKSRLYETFSEAERALFVMKLDGATL